MEPLQNYIQNLFNSSKKFNGGKIKTKKKTINTKS